MKRGGTVAQLDPEHKAAARETLERALDKIGSLQQRVEESQRRARKLSEALAFYDQWRAAPEAERIAVGRDAWTMLIEAAREVAEHE